MTQTMTTDHKHLFTGNRTLEDLDRLEMPKSGPTYSERGGLSHSEIANNLISYCLLRKWKQVGSLEVGVSQLHKEQKRQTEVRLGILLDPEGICRMEPGWNLALCLSHSHNLHVGAVLWHGVSPPEGTGITLGKTTLGKRGTRVGKTPFLPRLDEAMNEWVEIAKTTYDERIYHLLRWRLSRKELFGIVAKIGDEKINPGETSIPWSRLGRATLALQGDDFTFWEVLQQVSLAVRRGSPLNHTKQIDAFRVLLERLGRG